MKALAKFTIGALAFPLLILGCSTKKYDSWSECILEESKSPTSSSEWISIYCNSNYTPTTREKQASDRAFDRTDNPNEINEAVATEFEFGNVDENEEFETIAEKFGGRSVEQEHK
jgi:hypothetical protein